MLFREGEPFVTGRSTYFDGSPEAPESGAKIFVQIAAGDMRFLAQLDTGAPWSVIGPSVARELGLMGGQGVETTVSSRIGRIAGRLERMVLRLVAEDGQDLELEATVFVSEDWPDGRHFIGYEGLLQHMRFAVDPTSNHFYFGGM